jgi:dTDP-4-dehydrorhamnose reductase
MDIADFESVSAVLERWQPWAVVNAAGYVRVDDAEFESERCIRENTIGPAVLAAACHNRGTKFLTFSSDLVFAGEKNTPYVESDPVQPLNVYGKSKAEAERAVLALASESLIIRTSAFFGPWDQFNFVTATLKALASGQDVMVASDYMVSPTYVPDLVHASLDLLIDNAQGIWHLANRGAVTWSDLAMIAAKMGAVSTARLAHSRNCQLNSSAAKPRYSVLGSERADLMPSLMDALSRYFKHPDLSWKPALPALYLDNDLAA